MINGLTQDKQRLLNQRARVIWMTGLSGAGKTTIARGLEKELLKKGYLSQVIDGDELRAGLNKNLGYSNEDRKENLRRIAEISRLFINCGLITINSFISPTHEVRSMAKSIVGEDYYVEVFINAPLEVCEQRDNKGLYSKARQGLIKDFTGIDSPFEPPRNADIEIRTDRLTIKESIDKLLSYILPLVEYKK
jgi:adenylylsulfate kinase